MKLKPALITATQAQARVREVIELTKNASREEAIEERDQLLLDVLHTIAAAPSMAYKSHLKRLAGIALEAHEALEKE